MMDQTKMTLPKMQDMNGILFSHVVLLLKSTCRTYEQLGAIDTVLRVEEDPGFSPTTDSFQRAAVRGEAPVFIAIGELRSSTVSNNNDNIFSRSIWLLESADKQTFELMGYDLQSFYIQMMGYRQKEESEHVIFWEARLIDQVLSLIR